jgi:hypothetical protein
MNKTAFLALVLASFLLPGLALADSDDLATSRNVDSGWFGTLDSRSKYYTDWFPEPFRVEDTNINNEIRFDWEHDEAKGSVSDALTLEVQKSVGIFTFELQVPYIMKTGGGALEPDDGDPVGGGRTDAFGPVELGFHMPLLQTISKSGAIDNSVGFSLNAGVPTNTAIGKNASISPGMFDDLAIGNHFAVQSLFSFTHTFGTLPTGRAAFEYGLAFSYAIEDEQFSVPHVERLIPSVELVGETALDGPAAGHDILTGTVGIRAELKPILGLQPSLGVGYIFPIDSGGRNELRWGIITSLVFEF